MQVAIYVRLSEDKHGTELGVQRQEDECRAYAAERGWTVSKVYADNDISATSGKRRPALEELLAAKPGAILCWHIDRLVRLSKDLERVIELGVNVYAVQAGHLDLSTPAGRAVAKTVTAWAQYEGEQKAERQKASHRQRVKSGKPWWPTRPFGFEMDTTHRDDEAQALRETYADILNGMSLNRATKRLTERGLVTPKGKVWRASSLKPILLNSRNAGIYSYKGEEVGKAAWEPIVSEDVFRAVVRVLDSPERRTNWGRGGYNRRENLLTGIATCAKCGAGVRAAYRRNGATPYKTYQCSGNSCVTLPADWCDSVLVRSVIEKAEEWRDLLPVGSGGVDIAQLRTEEVALASRKAELGEAFAKGLLPMVTVEAGVKEIDRQLAELADKLADAAVSAAGISFWDTELLWQWSGDEAGEAYDLDKLTPVIKRMCRSIKLTGPGKGNRQLFYGTHLVVEWNEL